MRLRDYIAIICCVYLCIIFQSLVAKTADNSLEEKNFPQFRHVENLTDTEFAAPAAPLRLLVDLDFAPFGFAASSGAASGISVDLALAACTELRWPCQVVVVPFGDLLPALARGDGDMIISGLKLNENIIARADMTRPYFWSMGGFAVRLGSAFAAPDVKTLAGRRLGYVKGTSHGAFVESYYSRSALTPFDSEVAMFEALRTGSLDAVFGDRLRVSYWLQGTTARGCCEVLGGAFIDRATFSRNLAFLSRRDQPTLRAAFDYALDRLQDDGKTAEIFLRYVPADIW
jgi:polar amino acid transport system substrate-binding protein